MKLIAIIQARLNSSRLPKKVLRNIEHKPMIWHVVKRVSVAKKINKVIIATSNKPNDNRIEKFANENKIEIFRGSEVNCLDRYYRAARKFKAVNIIRITADCPLICPEIIDQVASEYLKGGYDYVSNTLVYTFPDGCDVEFFSFNALKKAWKQCKNPIEREHVTSYIKNSGKFKLKNVASQRPINPHDYKWSVDNIEDLKFVKKVYSYLHKNDKTFAFKDILKLLKKHPEIKKINSKTIVNEGYYKSFLKCPKIKIKKRKIKKSLSLKLKAEKLIPDCSQTFSKGPSQFIQGVSPVFLEKGKGSHVWDIDSNEYIDYAMALGPIILGHSYPIVVDAVENVLKTGTVFTLPHRLEVELADLLCKIIPCAEMVRFGKNGSDVTSGAIRIARAFTNRDKIACCGYHGWQDWYIATTTRDKGIPSDVKKLSLTFEYNNIESLKKVFHENKNQIACVIMEPVGIMEPRDNFLQKVKDVTHKNGALLIFDEVVTGFRFSLGGAQEYFSIGPDLACFGKAMGNGFPISAIVGKKEIMRLFEEVFFSFTFGGEITSITAAISTINELRNKNVIEYLWEQGRKIKDGLNVLAREYDLEEYVQCIGYYPRTVVLFKNRMGKDDLFLKSLFQQECIKRGILFNGCHNICFSHSNKDIDYTLHVYRTVLEIIRDAAKNNKVKKLLKGKPVQSIFRKA